MIYSIVCRLEGDVEKYHHRIVDELAKKFGITTTKIKNMPTHFTLKYPFETDDIKKIEQVANAFCKANVKKEIRVGGFGGFYPKVVYLDAKFSKDAKQAFARFVAALRKVEWMRWDKFDAEKMRFHITVAEDCNEKFDEIRRFVKTKEKHFNCWFDNVTILKLEGGAREIGEWKIHKTFEMK